MGHPTMKPARLRHPEPIDERHLARIARAALPALAVVALAGCEQNTYVPPPPVKVEVKLSGMVTSTSVAPGANDATPLVLVYWLPLWAVPSLVA